MKNPLVFISILALVLNSGVFQVRGQRVCSSNDHMVTSIPYWKKGVTLPCMYAGTFDVNYNPQGDDTHHLFYWLFKNLTHPSGDNTPLIMWLNGGPGSSSMFGLFLEDGPLRVKKTGPTLDDFELSVAQQGSWNE
jgi:carboxypeptidase C (cathepsin A)